MMSPDRSRDDRAGPRKILLPVDFSPCSEAALSYALRLGDIFGSDIDVLHVWEPLAPTSEGDLRDMGLFVATDEGLRLRELLLSLDQARPGRMRAVLEAGDPFRTIVAIATGYDLIVMGTHGRSGVRQLLSPSVAERVVRSAPCPVLTVRSRHEPLLPSLNRSEGGSA
jgi:universal stress protein A